MDSRPKGQKTVLPWNIPPSPQPKFGEWQPIESAPMDGKWVLITESTGTWMEVARWYEGEWCSYPMTIFGHKDEPPATHFMPLPAPPGEQT